MRAPRPYTPEPVDPEAVSPSGPWRAFKQFGLVLLCAAWVCMGLVAGPGMADDEGLVAPVLLASITSPP